MRNSLGIHNQPQSRVTYRDSVGKTTGRESMDSSRQ
jgi:hypothetical protein